MDYVKSVCIYCGASKKALENEAYMEAIQKLGKLLAEEKIRLVFGGGKSGLMGAIADAVIDNGGTVLGIITEHLHDIEIGHDKITELRIVESMHERKSMMFQESDGFLVLPGGFGTLDEVCEIITWKQIKLHDKPIGFIDIEKYWSPLFDNFVQHMIKAKIITNKHRDFYQILDTVEEVRPFLDKMELRNSLMDHKRYSLVWNYFLNAFFEKNSLKAFHFLILGYLRKLLAYDDKSFVRKLLLHDQLLLL